MGTADHGGASSWTARYVTVLSQARWLVLASWALLSVLAAWQGPLFLSDLDHAVERLRGQLLPSPSWSTPSSCARCSSPR